MIIRCEHVRDYTVITNDIINDGELDWKDLGLLVYLLSKPKKWEVSVPHLAKIRKSGRDSIYKSLNILIGLGYAKRVTLKTGYVNWYISEVKNMFLMPFTEKPETVVNKPFTENPEMAFEGNTKNSEISPESPEKQAGTPVLIPFTEKPFTEKPFTELPTLVNKEVYKVQNVSKYNNTTAREENIKSVVGVVEDNGNLALSWVEYFVNVLGYSIHEAQDSKTMPMFREWVKMGVTRTDIEDAKLDMEKSLGIGNKPASPIYYRKIIKAIIDRRNRPELCSERNNGSKQEVNYKDTTWYEGLENYQIGQGH